MYCMQCGVRSEFPRGEASISRFVPGPVALPVESLPPIRKLPLLLAVLLALTGGVFGIVTVVPLELPHAVSFLATVLWAPIFEELAKPIGVYVLLARWPATLNSRWRAGALCAIGGLAFGLVESCIYMFVYFRDHSQALLLFRFAIPPLMHAVASFVFGLGLTAGFFSDLGRGFRPRAANWTFFLSAMLIHAFYNGMVTQFASFQFFNDLR